MAITAEQIEAAAAHWGLSATLAEKAPTLAAYGNLLLRWNARLALTAIRDEAEVVDRHLMEGLFAAQHCPNGPSVLDFGSGTGIPGIPIAISRPDLTMTLAEANRKKVAFLQEALRVTVARAVVHADRAERLSPGSFDVVWMRAVDRSQAMLPVAAALVSSGGALCLLGGGEAPGLSGWGWKSRLLPGSKSRVLHIGHRVDSSTWNT